MVSRAGRYVITDGESVWCADTRYEARKFAKRLVLREFRPVAILRPDSYTRMVVLEKWCVKRDVKTGKWKASKM